MGNFDNFEGSCDSDASSAASRRTKCLSTSVRRFSLLKYLTVLVGGVNNSKNSYILHR
jgi:hypothetical protein